MGGAQKAREFFNCKATVGSFKEDFMSEENVALYSYKFNHWFLQITLINYGHPPQLFLIYNLILSIFSFSLFFPYNTKYMYSIQNY